jgi:hypothetical protein
LKHAQDLPQYPFSGSLFFGIKIVVLDAILNEYMVKKYCSKIEKSGIMANLKG